MVSGFKFGDAVKVWPMPGLRVQAHYELPGRFISADGEDMAWSQWLHARFSDGSISLTDPRPQPQASAKPAKDKG